MDWITKEQVKKAAKAGEMEALQCSLEHHKQGRDCTRGELVDAIEGDIFTTGAVYCACCELFNKNLMCISRNPKCPLRSDGKSSPCCEGNWRPTELSLIKFKDYPTPENFRAFQDAEAKVCEYIQSVIDGKKAEAVKPERLGIFGDYGQVEGCNGKKSFFVQSNSSDTELMVKYVSTKGHITWSNVKYLHDHKIVTFLGNIFDDIAERGKELEEFEVEECFTGRHVKIRQGEIEGVVLEGTAMAKVSVTLVGAKELHRKLGQVINYAENHKGK
jgi:hypothetical protein